MLKNQENQIKYLIPIQLCICSNDNKYCGHAGYLPGSNHYEKRDGCLERSQYFYCHAQFIGLEQYFFVGTIHGLLNHLAMLSFLLSSLEWTLVPCV